MIITLDNLSAGIDWFCKRKGWGKDLMNNEYHEIYDHRALYAVGTEPWWRMTVDRLSKWRAIRSPTPLTKEMIIVAGLPHLREIGARFTGILELTPNQPSIEKLNWEHIEGLFVIASLIKPTKSPVFAGKLCHSVFPRLFTFMDHEATGISEYEIYWRGMKDAWHTFAEKQQAIDILRSAIQSDKPIHRCYPFGTKIVELSHIGYRHRTCEEFLNKVEAFSQEDSNASFARLAASGKVTQ